MTDPSRPVQARDDAAPDATAADTLDTDRARVRAWTEPLLDQPWHLPVTFRYGGAPVRGVPQAWSPTTRTRTTGPGTLETVVEGRDPATGLGLRVEVVRHAGFPVVEWTAWLTNHSPEPTPLVEDLQALDASFTTGTADGPTTVQHCNGDFYSVEGYTWTETTLGDGEPLRLAPNGGRPCDGAFPYLRLLVGGGGLSLAVGWPGQWAATFAQQETGVAVRAGQETTRLRLLPGETIRTPRITLLAWEGTPERAANLWRRWYREHVLPRPGGVPVRPLLSAAATDEGEEFTGATEDNQVEYQRRWAATGLGYDVWWVDAGWYPCRTDDGRRRWTKTGTWTADPERFPHGLASVSAAGAANGAELLLWFEPERVTPGTQTWEEHPEWVLRRPDVDHDDPSLAQHARSGLLDLSDDACRRWLTDLVSGLIDEYGIGVYRQDFNFAPAPFWAAKDTPERQGATENLHVQGYLAFWDGLLERHPHLLIDSCASGGRRNDLETMRRSVPLHYTDYGYGEHATKLDFHRTLFEWLPYFRESSQSWDLEEAARLGVDAAQDDAFAYHCALAPMLTPTVDVRRPDTDLTAVRTMTRAWRRAVEILLGGDYHPLSPPGRSDDAWVAWQFDRPPALAARGTADGFVQAIRLARSGQESLTLRLAGLRSDATYLLEEAETGERRRATGAALASEGLTLELPPRSGSIWFYAEEVG